MLSCSDYLALADQMFKKEEDFCKMCFAQDTWSEFKSVLEFEFFLKYKHDFVTKPGTGVAMLLVNRDKNNLRKIYDILYPVPNALDPMIVHLETHVFNEGSFFFCFLESLDINQMKN